MGFGPACAPVRYAHPSSWAHCHAKQDAARPPSPPIAASLLLIWPPKIHKIYPTLAAHVKGGLFSFHCTAEAMRSPAPRPAPSGNILGSKVYTSVTIRTNFSVFLFFSFWIFSFRYSLLFLLSFSISSYSSLLIFSYSSRRAIFRLLILFLLYFKLFVVLQTCILIIYVHISVILRGF